MTSRQILPSEDQIHVALCEYIRKKYPRIIFTSDSSGVRISIGAAKKLKQKRSSSGIPDLLILQPTNRYHGLFIEIKRSTSEVYTKKGELRGDKHIREQQEILKRLQELGYLAVFGCGLDECCAIVDCYLNLNLSFSDEI